MYWTQAKDVHERKNTWKNVITHHYPQSRATWWVHHNLLDLLLLLLLLPSYAICPPNTKPPSLLQSLLQTLNARACPHCTRKPNICSQISIQGVAYQKKENTITTRHLRRTRENRPIIQPSKPQFHSPASLPKNKNTKIKWLRKWGTMSLLCSSTWSLARPPTRPTQAFLLPPSPSNLHLNPRFFFSRH